MATAVSVSSPLHVPSTVAGTSTTVGRPPRTIIAPDIIVVVVIVVIIVHPSRR